jgi:hypothetical protein
VYCVVLTITTLVLFSDVGIEEYQCTLDA